MANETKEIGEIAKKCKILLLDIEGTTTSISFVKDKLFPYAEEHVQKFLETEWEKEDVKEAVAALRKLALEDQENKVEGAVAIPGEDASKEEQIGGLVGSVKWQMSADRKAGPLKLLQGLIWKQGYDNGDIKGHVYDDVAAALDQWRSTEGNKVYIYSSGSVQAQKLLFGQSLAGDLLPRIDGHFDTAVGPKQEAASYTAIAEKIGAKPEEILFLTDIIEEASAAAAAGLRAALVRRAPAPAPPATTPAFPVLTSLAQLASNKRKPHPQEEETPAKVPKTDAEKGVKETAEAAAAASQADEQEKMEVEPPTAAEDTPQKDEPVKVVTVIEEITDTSEVADVPMVDVEPVVEEDTKIEEILTDKEPAKTEPEEPKEVQMEKPVAEETPPAAVTVIEEVCDEPSPEATVDLEPVVEEPLAEDMDVLQNVGEVLEKECDEILSKVQDVTNLDSIPVKPLLNTIAEETMETENTDTNDIVDRILDSELELEMKQNEILNSAAADGNEAKAENGVEVEADIERANGVEENIADEILETNVNEDSSSIKATEAKAEDSSSVETRVEEHSMETATESKESTEEPSQVAATAGTAEKAIEESTTAEENKPEPETSENVPGDEKPVEESSSVTEAQPDSKPAEEKKETEKSKPEESTPEETSTPQETSEPQVNGKSTNGDSAPVNGNSTDEACSRLIAVNGKAENGSNGDATEAPAAASGEDADIKVKSVPAAGPAAAVVDQPTEA